MTRFLRLPSSSNAIYDLNQGRRNPGKSLKKQRPRKSVVEKSCTLELRSLISKAEQVCRNRSLLRHLDKNSSRDIHRRLAS
jgi:hypothetical protein